MRYNVVPLGAVKEPATLAPKPPGLGEPKRKPWLPVPPWPPLTVKGMRTGVAPAPPITVHWYRPGVVNLDAAGP